MRILLLGANGQMGRALRSPLSSLGEVVMGARDEDPVEGLVKADLALEGEVGSLIETLRPDYVVNVAAYTAVDKAEQEPALAERVNHHAVFEIARACTETGAALVHISTDYVFDGGGEGPYQPGDPTYPLGVYGVSKLRGEQAIRSTGCTHVMLRTAWAYGLEGSNFLTTMLRLGAEREELGVVNDQIGSPTPTWWIAEVISRVIRKGVSGGATHHMVTEGQVSWHGFALAIFEEAVARGMLARSPKVRAITSDDYPTPARRPPYSVLDTRSLRAAYDIEPLQWRVALMETFDRGGVRARPSGRGAASIR